jgi:hypothetical protein
MSSRYTNRHLRGADVCCDRLGASQRDGRWRRSSTRVSRSPELSTIAAITVFDRHPHAATRIAADHQLRALANAGDGQMERDRFAFGSDVRQRATPHVGFA